jgi:hypothetical protein
MMTMMMSRSAVAGLGLLLWSQRQTPTALTRLLAVFLQAVDPGTWGKADATTMARRKVVKVRRGAGAGAADQPAASSNPFAGVALAPPAAANPFAGVSLTPSAAGQVQKRWSCWLSYSVLHVQLLSWSQASFLALLPDDV